MNNLFEKSDLVDIKNSLNLKISGENYIEIETMVNSLIALNNILKSASEEIYPNLETKMVIDKVEPGNSITTFLTILGAVLGISADSITVAKTIVSIFQLRKHLKGEKPKKVTTIVNDSENVIVQNIDGTNNTVNINVFNTYVSNPSIEQNLNKFGKDLSSTNRTSFELLETTENNLEDPGFVSFDKGDIESLTKKIPVNEIDVDPEDVLTKETLYLVTAKYNSTAMWDFTMSDGQRISAQIHDINFLNKVNSGMIGTTGKTEMKVDLLTVINKGLTTSNRKIKTRYYIKKVHEISNPFDGETPTLFDYIL